MASLRTRIVLRNDTTANWLVAQSVVLLKGEIGIEFLADGKTKLKIGDGIKTWAELDYFGGDFESVEVALAALQKDVADINEVLFPTAEGSKTLLSRVEELEVEVSGVDQKIEDSINEFAAKISDDGTVNTLKELIDYVAEHGAEASQMVSDIAELKGLVGETSVEEQIGIASDSLLAQINKTEEKLKVVSVAKKYEIAYKPVGTLVDYRDKEIRVMCPADTQWVQQTVGTNGNANMYYMGFKAYAPEGAVSFKEDDQFEIADQTMYYFENNDFAGIDAYGRKYSIVWLALAQYDEATQAWSYFGEKSTTSKYIGWYYSVEWYGADGKIINADTIRINLSNENCHKNIEPYYMANINVNKLVQDDGDVLILNGGAAN